MKKALTFTSILCASLALAQNNFEQVPMYALKPWLNGSLEDALKASRAGATIPLSTYSIKATKDNSNKPHTGTIVGTSPFAATLTGSTIDAVVIPTVLVIGTSAFDPTAPNSCDGGVSPQTRFMSSPLVMPVNNLTFNGVDVGNVQYIDGFMRAQFWSTIGGNPAYSNPINYTLAAPVTIITGTNGITSGTGCSQLGVVSESFLTSQIVSQLQTLTASGAVSTSKVAMFLMLNTVLSPTSPPTLPTSGCCILGYHSATGSTPQFYAVMDYINPGTFTRTTDMVVAAHEIGELMNDPLGANATPAWGGIGSRPAGSCQDNLEVGDPLVAIAVPIDLNGYTYHMQELAFFSWFFNSPSAASLGAGGKFSSNGSFSGPSMACPPGGTY